MTWRIDTRLTARRIIDDGDMLLFRALPTLDRPSVGTFVSVDHHRDVDYSV